LPQAVLSRGLFGFLFIKHRVFDLIVFFKFFFDGKFFSKRYSKNPTLKYPH